MGEDLEPGGAFGAARAFGVRVEASDLAALKAQLLQQFPDEAQIDAELVKRYGWNFATYEKKVMRPFILQNKLGASLQADEGRRAVIKKQAEDVLLKIKNGDDFAELAKQYGQDGTAPQGGDLGWFGKGDMVPEFEAAAWGLTKGQVAPELVETTFGYHIIKLDDRRKDPSKYGQGKTVSTAEQIRARHILFRFPSLDQYLDNELKQARIKLYIKAFNPFQGLKTS
jgi:hypothetical protein